MNRDDISKMHHILLEDLKYLSDICTTNNIDFFLSSGSLLGAVRHEGFIPWDNDLDVMMTRENFEKFLLIVDQVNSERYKVCTYKNDPSMPTIYAHLIDRNAIFCWKENGNESDYLHIDIYACDYIKESMFAKTKLAEKLVHFYNRIFCYRRGFVSINANGYRLKKMAIRTGLLLFKHTSDEKLAKKIINLVGTPKETKTMAPIASPYGFMREQFPSAYYKELMMHKFEDSEFPISKHYHEVLTKLYGDYMSPPPEETQYKDLDRFVFRVLK